MATRAEVAKALGEAVRKLREERGWTQEEAAAKCQIDRAYFGALDRGRRVPSLHTLIRVADGLGVSAQQLVARTERNLGRARRGSG
jgi:transcriptional regulator with XRE-family HTH domain